MEVKATRVLVPGSIVPGIGYMTRTQTVCIKAVEGEVVEKPNEWAPSYDIDYVGTYESLNKFYSLSASARYSGASGGASASVSIMRTAKLERSVVILAVKVRASTGRIFFTEPKLTRDAHDWAKAGMPGYVAKFGDSYVRSITYGGEVAALLVVSASSSESLRLLRARAEAHGFGASGETNTTNMIQEVSKENKVRVIYNQSGGGAGEDSGGIIEIAPKELLERMSAFIAELRKTDPLKGSVIPLEAEFWPATKTLNWPGGDPAHPFPPDIENIAETLDMLRDRLDRTNHIIQNSADFPPSTSEAASVIKAYIETTVTGAGIHLRQMIEDKLAVASLPLETLAQYRLRGLCGVEPGLHENAGPRMDANSVDKAQLANTLIGPDTFPRIDRWPQFELLEDWGVPWRGSGRISRPLVALRQRRSTHRGKRNMALGRQDQRRRWHIYTRVSFDEGRMA